MRIKLKVTKKRRFIDSKRSFKEYCSLYNCNENPRKYFRWQKIIDKQKLMQSLPLPPSNPQSVVQSEQMSQNCENLNLSQRVSFVKMNNLTKSTYSTDNQSFFELKKPPPNLELFNSVPLFESIQLQFDHKTPISANSDNFSEEIAEPENFQTADLQNPIVVSEEEENVQCQNDQNMEITDAFNLIQEVPQTEAGAVRDDEDIKDDSDTNEMNIDSSLQREKIADLSKETDTEENQNHLQTNLEIENENENVNDITFQEDFNPKTTNMVDEENMDLTETLKSGEPMLPIEEVGADTLPYFNTGPPKEETILSERSVNREEEKSNMELENQVTPQKNKSHIPEKFLTRSFQRLHGLSESIQKSVNELNAQLTFAKNSVGKLKHSNNHGQTSTLSQDSFEAHNADDQSPQAENLLQAEGTRDPLGESRSHNILVKPSCQKSAVKSVQKETPISKGLLESGHMTNSARLSGLKGKCSKSKCNQEGETTPNKKSEGKIAWSSQTEAKIKLNKAERLRMDFIKRKSVTVAKDNARNPRTVEDREKGWSIGKSNLLI